MNTLKIKNMILTAMAVTCLSSCNDFLEYEP